MTELDPAVRAEHQQIVLAAHLELGELLQAGAVHDIAFHKGEEECPGCRAIELSKRLHLMISSVDDTTPIVVKGRRVPSRAMRVFEEQRVNHRRDLTNKAVRAEKQKAK